MTKSVVKILDTIFFPKILEFLKILSYLHYICSLKISSDVDFIYCVKNEMLHVNLFWKIHWLNHDETRLVFELCAEFYLIHVSNPLHTSVKLVTVVSIKCFANDTIKIKYDNMYMCEIHVLSMCDKCLIFTGSNLLSHVI